MTNSAAFMSINFLPRFIEAYRNHQCLWRIKSKEYSNKQLKDTAYEELVDLTKQAVPDCDLEFVKKKIDLIRGSFRREHKKVQTSMTSGAGTESVYTPKLWYYKLLLFLSEQDEVQESKGNLTADIVEGNEEEEKSSNSRENNLNKVCTCYNTVLHIILNEKLY